MLSEKELATYKPSWETQKARIKLKFPQLTNIDVNFPESQKDEMLRQLGERLGVTPQALQAITETYV